MSVIEEESKVKVLSQAEQAKRRVDEQGLTPSQIADLMILLARDLKKDVKESKKTKKVEGDVKEKKPLNEGLKIWHGYVHYLQTKLQMLKTGSTIPLKSMIRLGSILKGEGYYPEDKLTDEVLLRKYEDWSILTKEEQFPSKEDKPKAERKPRAKKVKEEVKEEVKEMTPEGPKPVRKTKTKPVEIIVKPEEGVFLAQAIKGTKYLTCAYDGDDYIYLYNEEQEYQGAYDVTKKEIDQLVSDPTA